jgi:flagellar hook protein FlgE
MLLPLGCGDYVSWNERWPFDGGHEHASTPPGAGEAAPVAECAAAPIEGYGYADPPEFWLGTQAEFALRVDGPGYLVAGTPGGDASELRYLRSARLSVGTDGGVEIGGEPALGYPLDVAPDGACLSSLRAPNLAPPRATSSIDIGMNVDSRSNIVTFDVLDPEATSNGAVSMLVFDSGGTTHYLDIYFSHQGGRVWQYDVLVDGGDLVGGTPGQPVLVSTGTLQFDSTGALSLATTPPFEVSFAGGVAPSQRIALSYGRDIASGGSGLERTVNFASDSAVFSLSVDGRNEGTASGVDVRPNGELLVYYDNGDAVPIGSLALARFPREAALASDGEGWGPTSDSGAPSLGAPQSLGRGMIVVESVSAWP